MQKMNIGFLASHNGSNMQSVINACQSEELESSVAVVISNNRNSGALERAEREGIPNFCLNGVTDPDPVSLDKKILSVLKDYKIDIVVLAGYMKKLGAETLNYYEGRILNIHPALLPKFGGRGMYGIHVHEAVILSAESETGVTVHLVDQEYDTGAIIAQSRVKVLPDDNAKSLAKRVLEEEHAFLPSVLKSIEEGNISIKPFNKTKA